MRCGWGLGKAGTAHLAHIMPARDHTPSQPQRRNDSERWWGKRRRMWRLAAAAAAVAAQQDQSLTSDHRSPHDRSTIATDHFVFVDLSFFGLLALVPILRIDSAPMQYCATGNVGGCAIAQRFVRRRAN